MQGSVLKMLERNKVSEDSAKFYIQSTANSKLKENFWNCISPESNTRYKALRDSLGVSSQWNSFQIKKIKESKGLEKIILSNDDNEQNRYYGRAMNKRWLDTLTILIKESKAKHVICLNKFEVKDKRDFTNDAAFILHLEVYDENATKIFGGKFMSRHSLSQHTSYSLFPYLIRNAIDDFYVRLKEYIN